MARCIPAEDCITGSIRTICKVGNCSYYTINSALAAANANDELKIVGINLSNFSSYTYNETINWAKSNLLLDCNGATIGGNTTGGSGIFFNTGVNYNQLRSDKKGI